MRTLQVNVQDGYEIIIRRGVLGEAGRYASSLPGVQKCAVISDSNVAPLYADRLLSSLRQAGLTPLLHTFPAGETSKHMESICGMLSFLAEHAFSRSDLVIALGGGVTGDMAGFAASIYLRGIPLIQIPTSLLAQIDSSVGGKTGIDLPQGKNLCGSFYQPSLVLIDPDLLSTLPDRYQRDGMGEAIKYGCIRSSALLDTLEQGVTPENLEDMIWECVDIKRQLVEQDELDHGDRMLLNFGHTFGHAIERYVRYQTFSHGEAVGLGMLISARAGEALGITEQGSYQRIKGLLQQYGLPCRCDIPLEGLLEIIGLDKKRRGDHISFVFLSRPGESFYRNIPLKDFAAQLRPGMEGVVGG